MVRETDAAKREPKVTSVSLLDHMSSRCADRSSLDVGSARWLHRGRHDCHRDDRHHRRRRCQARHVEVDTDRKLPSFTIVALPDSAVRESRERVMAAIRI